MRNDLRLRSVSAGLACLALGAVAVAMAMASRPAARAVIAGAENGGWALVYDHPFLGKYEDFAFPNGSDGWLVNARGEIFHSADSGATWTVQATGKGPLRSIDFLDEKRGFAGTLSGILYGTTDGGATWTDITGQLPRPAKGFCGMTHVGEHVHIVGRYNGAAADYYSSPDGGKTWRASDLRDLAQGLVDVSFLSDSVGLVGGMSNTGPPAAGPAVILKTTDGGKTWRTVFTHDGGRGFAWKIFPLSPKLIWASLQSQDGTYRAVKSTDAGDTWTVQTIATGRAEGPGLQGIGFLDDNTGWVGGFFQGMFETTDGGRTWFEAGVTDRTVNRFERVGKTMITASTRGVLRYDGKH
jgi:photosystem II stability/assembly factor-like uncharacterized protein